MKRRVEEIKSKEQRTKDHRNIKRKRTGKG